MINERNEMNNDYTIGYHARILTHQHMYFEEDDIGIRSTHSHPELLRLLEISYYRTT